MAITDISGIGGIDPRVLGTIAKISRALSGLKYGEIKIQVVAGKAIWLVRRQKEMLHH